MNGLAAAIHRHWQTAATLVARVPSERFWTGPAPETDRLPYAVLELRAAQPLARTSTGTCAEAINLRFHLYGQELEAAEHCAAEVRRRFDRAELTWRGGRVLNLQPAGGSQERTERGLWHVTIDYRAICLA